MLRPILTLHSFFFTAQLAAIVLLLTSALLELLEYTMILGITSDARWSSRVLAVGIGGVRHGHVDVWVLCA